MCLDKRDWSVTIYETEYSEYEDKSIIIGRPVLSCQAIISDSLPLIGYPYLKPIWLSINMGQIGWSTSSPTHVDSSLSSMAKDLCFTGFDRRIGYTQEWSEDYYCCYLAQKRFCAHTGPWYAHHLWSLICWTVSDSGGVTFQSNAFRFWIWLQYVDSQRLVWILVHGHVCHKTSFYRFCFNAAGGTLTWELQKFWHS